MWVQRATTHHHSGQFPMLSYAAMCTGASVQARAGEAGYIICIMTEEVIRQCGGSGLQSNAPHFTPLGVNCGFQQ